MLLELAFWLMLLGHMMTVAIATKDDVVPGELLVVLSDDWLKRGQEFVEWCRGISVEATLIDAGITAEERNAALLGLPVLYRLTIVGSSTNDGGDGTSASAIDALASHYLDVLARHPAVEIVEPNMRVRLGHVQASTGASDSDSSEQQRQDNAPWALDRIDQRRLPLDRSFSFQRDFSGGGVHIYVIDTYGGYLREGVISS